VSGYTYVWDTGFLKDDIDTGGAFPSFTYNLSADQNWTNFIAAAGPNVGDIRWAVVAGDTNSGSIDNDPISYLSTGPLAGLPTGIEATRNAQFRNGTGPISNYLNYLGAHLGFDESSAGQSLLHLKEGPIDAASFEVALGQKWGPALTFNITGLLGDTLGLYALEQDPTTNRNTGAILQTLIGNASVVDGVLTVSAIPEADTWAMLLAGLGLVGTLARRRNGSRPV
jgi:MYXO-CTERM domain-containing protein